jgi:hypothetical protein
MLLLTAKQYIPSFKLHLKRKQKLLASTLCYRPRDENVTRLTQKINRDHMLEIIFEAHHYHNMPATCLRRSPKQEAARWYFLQGLPTTPHS